MGSSAGGSGGTTTGGLTSADAGCLSVLQLNHCPAGEVEIAGTLIDACNGFLPISQVVEVQDALASNRTAMSDACGNYYFCVSPGTVVTPLLQVPGFLPVEVASVDAKAPLLVTALLICDAVVQSLEGQLKADLSKAMVMVEVSPDGASGVCPESRSGWQFALQTSDGGPIADDSAAVTGLGFIAGDTVTQARGRIFFDNIDPSLTGLRVVGIFDGGPVCQNELDAYPFEYAGSIPLLPGTLTLVPFIPQQSAILSGAPTCVTASASAVVTTLAGQRLVGFRDGVARLAGAAFQELGKVISDGQGNVYVSDLGNHAVRKLDAQGNVSTLAGNGLEGFADGRGGPNDLAELNHPIGMAADLVGNLFVADSYNHAIRKIDTQGNVTTWAGNGLAGFVDGLGSDAQFAFPNDVAVDPQGNLYVADTDNCAIRKIDPSGAVSTVAGSGDAGFVDGTASVASFNQPNGIAVDDSGNLFIADSFNQAIRKIDSAGNVTTVAGNGTRGSVDGAGGRSGTAELDTPVTVQVDGQGNLLVVDQSPAVRRVDPLGNVSTVSFPGVFFDSSLAGATVGAGGSIFASDLNQLVRVDDAGLTVFGMPFPLFVDGPSGGAAALFNYPHDLALDDGGNLWIADTSNGAIRKLDPSGQVTTVASGPALGRPTGIALDGQGGFYVAASSILDVSANGTVTTLVPGAGAYGVAVDSAGTLYAVTGNNLVLKIVAGVVSILAGDGDAGFNDGDGGGVFDQPRALAVDGAGNLFVADSNNHAVRKIDPQGNVSTVAGNGSVGSLDGPGGRQGVAEFSAILQGIDVDRLGNLYVGDFGNNSIRKIDPAGNVSTLAGASGAGGLDGTGGCAGSAQLGATSGVAVDGAGNVFFIDNCEIREISP